MTTIRTRFRVLALLLAVMAVLATPLSAGAATDSPDDFIVSGSDTGRTRVVEPLAKIQLDNGDEIVFTPVGDARGRTQGVIVSGVRSAGRTPVSSVKGLEDANPLEMFVALARPDVNVPKVLRDLYGADGDHGTQGWARDLVLTTRPQGTSCPASYWQHRLADHAAAFNHDPFISSWDGPQTEPQHWSGPVALGDGNVYHDLVGRAKDVTGFYGSVLYCVEDHENVSIVGGNYVGNWVSARWRVAGTGTWNVNPSQQLTDVGDMFEHVFAPGNAFSPSAQSFDFQVRITSAKPGDQFHIGATWVPGRPSGLKSND